MHLACSLHLRAASREEVKLQSPMIFGLLFKLSYRSGFTIMPIKPFQKNEGVKRQEELEAKILQMAGEKAMGQPLLIGSRRKRRHTLC